MKRLMRWMGVCFLVGLVGCETTYIPPGPKADLAALAPAAIEDGFAARPSNPFPASIAFVRVQSPRYSNHNLRQHGGQAGTGRYTIVTAREVESPEQLQRVLALPQVAGVVGLNRMLIPDSLQSDQEIRQAAARLQADLVLMYTFDTVFFDIDRSTTLSAITLGFSPTRRITVTTTVSALLLDTRTGFVYSAYEATHQETLTATTWGSADAADRARLEAETRAFANLVDEFAGTWPQILARYAPAS
ncbi:MAG: hypothetical protein LR015_02890 [Verrucomicrobia bacterium]|nr:hypothetical protein [Verrucomicrobiota bacterium]